MFLISLYGATMAQRTFNLALHSSLFEPDGTVNYDYIVSNSINCPLRCISNDTYTNHCWVYASKRIKSYVLNALYLAILYTNTTKLGSKRSNSSSSWIVGVLYKKAEYNYNMILILLLKKTYLIHINILISLVEPVPNLHKGRVWGYAIL